MARRLTPRGKERRSQLMAFAAERFAENGYHTTSVAEIVEGLGVGKGVFYWYFSSKEELFLEILKDAQQDLRRTQRQAIDGIEDPVERITSGIRASLQWSADHRHYHSLVQFAATEERFAPALRKGQEVAARDAMRHVSDAIAAGAVRDADPALITHGILGITTHLARVFIHDLGKPADEVADAAVAFVLDGVLAADRQPTAA
ncbi:MAG: TetR/AcrR family transcriptional regulator [Acidimicrobiia bacterium]|nr:TetR/AcrR family transcriptional regulator [Acidimicrobiia bacterium]